MRDAVVILNYSFSNFQISNSYQEEISWEFSVKLPSGEYHRTQVMVWCEWYHQATSHFLSQHWPRSVSPYGVTRPQWVNFCTVSSRCELSIWNLIAACVTRPQWVNFCTVSSRFQLSIWNVIATCGCITCISLLSRTPVSLIMKCVWLFTQWEESAECSFICCNRYSVKQVFYN